MCNWVLVSQNNPDSSSASTRQWKDLDLGYNKFHYNVRVSPSEHSRPNWMHHTESALDIYPGRSQVEEYQKEMHKRLGWGSRWPFGLYSGTGFSSSSIKVTLNPPCSVASRQIIINVSHGSLFPPNFQLKHPNIYVLKWDPSNHLNHLSFEVSSLYKSPLTFFHVQECPRL